MHVRRPLPAAPQTRAVSTGARGHAQACTRGARGWCVDQDGGGCGVQCVQAACVRVPDARSAAHLLALAVGEARGGCRRVKMMIIQNASACGAAGEVQLGGESRMCQCTIAAAPCPANMHVLSNMHVQHARPICTLCNCLVPQLLER